MIRYDLACGRGHAFEGWFRSIADYDAQEQAGALACPVCGSLQVSKAVMAPAVRSSDKAVSKAAVAGPAQRLQFMKALRSHVIANFENVGERFPEEARKIHYGETEERPIYGDASRDEAVALLEEGIAVAPLPSDEPVN